MFHGKNYVSMTEVKNDGQISQLQLRVDEVVAYFSKATSLDQRPSDYYLHCFQDLAAFFSQSDFAAPNKQHLHFPNTSGILPRPHLGFFFIDFMELKVICWKNQCLILDTDNPLNEAESVFEVFKQGLSNSLQQRKLKGCIFEDSWHHDVIQLLLDGEEHSFEMLVLDNALYAVIRKLNNHLKITKPIFKILHEESVKKPAEKVLQRISAFGKSLETFNTNLSLVHSALNVFLENEPLNPEKVQLLVEGYKLDLQDIQLSIASMLSHIDEAKENINKLMAEARNRIIRLSLNIELSMLGLGFGAFLGSVFGMNLMSGLESDPNAFVTTSSFIFVVSAMIICFLAWRCSSIMDLRSRSHHPVLKNFFKYIDLLETVKKNKGKLRLMKSNFGEHLKRIISNDVSSEDVDLLYHVLEEKDN